MTEGLPEGMPPEVAYHGHAALVRGLVARGADVERANLRSQTPLAGAVFTGEAESAAMFGSDLGSLLPPPRA